MTWAKVDDHANEHRKQLAAGAEACWLWTCGLMYANRQAARDGFIPEAALSMLYPFKNASYAASLALRLVTVGLWEVTDGGYLVHEFTFWNESKERREETLARGRERAAKSYANRRDSSPPLQRRESEERPKTPSEENASLQNSSGSTPLPLPARSDLPPTPSVLPPPPGGADISTGDLASFAPEPAKIRRKEAKNPKEPRPKQAQWRRFPPDFEPDESHRKIAAELGLDLAGQLTGIRDHEFKSPKSDPAAVFRTWLRNAPNFTPAPRLSPLRGRREPEVSPNVDYETRAALASSRRLQEFLAGAK